VIPFFLRAGDGEVVSVAAAVAVVVEEEGSRDSRALFIRRRRRWMVVLTLVFSTPLEAIEAAVTAFMLRILRGPLVDDEGGNGENATGAAATAALAWSSKRTFFTGMNWFHCIGTALGAALSILFIGIASIRGPEEEEDDDTERGRGFMKNFTHVKKKKNFYNGPVPPIIFFP
jgi:hypothetical protein